MLTVSTLLGMLCKNQEAARATKFSKKMIASSAIGQ